MQQIREEMHNLEDNLRQETRLTDLGVHKMSLSIQQLQDQVRLLQTERIQFTSEELAHTPGGADKMLI